MVACQHAAEVLRGCLQASRPVEMSFKSLRIVKGLEPKFGHFVTKAAEGPKKVEKAEEEVEEKAEKAKKEGASMPGRSRGAL